MAEHIHYDIEAFKRELEAATERMEAMFRKLITEAETDHQKSFLATQMALIRWRCDPNVIIAGLVNDGHDRKAITAGVAVSLGIAFSDCMHTAAAAGLEQFFIANFTNAANGSDVGRFDTGEPIIAKPMNGGTA